MLATSNIFAALDTKKAKKKKSKDSDKKKKDKGFSAAELERAIFSQPTIKLSNWADCDDEDEFGDMGDLPPSWQQVSTRRSLFPPSAPSLRQSERDLTTTLHFSAAA